MPSSARALATLLACVAALACRAREAPRSEPPSLEHELATSSRATPPRSLPDDAKGAHELRTHAGTYLVRWRASIDPIVEGDTFSVDAWISPASDPSVLADDVVLD